MLTYFSTEWTQELANSFPGSAYAVTSAFLPNLILNFCFCKPSSNLLYEKEHIKMCSRDSCKMTKRSPVPSPFFHLHMTKMREIGSKFFLFLFLFMS